jgi:DNA replication licensing factor MCM3
MKDQVEKFMAQRDLHKRTEKLIGAKGNRLGISLDELLQFDQELSDFVRRHPIEAINMFENQLDGMIKDMKDDGNKGGQSEKQSANQGDRAFPTKVKKYYINFEGEFGRNHVTPRGLKADLVNQLVSVRGIVTKMNLIKPKIQTSVHYCETTKKGMVKHYTDQTNLATMAEDC